MSASGQANPGFGVSYLVIWAQSPSGNWTPVGVGTGVNNATISCSGSRILDAAGTWNWTLRLQTSGPSGSPAGNQLASGSTTVNPATTSVSFSFSTLSHTYDGGMKTASVSPNPGNATYSADLTKGPGVGSYTVTATGTGSFVGSGSATLTINAAPDTSAPSTPGNVHVTAFDQSSVTFAWNASSDNVGVTGYQVRQNQGSPVTASGLSHTFYGLVNNTNYLLEARAGDAAGNWSGWGGAAASTGSSGGGGSGSGASLWADVNGDGIRDEVVKAGSADFSYTIDWWYTTDQSAWNLQINSYWGLWNLFRPEGALWFPNHIAIWAGESQINAAHRNTTTTGVTLTINPRPGRQLAIYQDPTGSTTFNPAAWEVIQPHMGPIGQSPFVYTQPFYTAGSLDGTAIYLAHLGTPVASLQFRDIAGNVLINSVVVDGTANLFIPTNGQVSLGVRDTVGFLDGAHTVAWKILDAVGNILRQGTGLNVNFDSLSPSLIARLAVLLDNALQKSVSVNATKIELEFQNSKMSSGKLIDPISPPANVRVGVITGDVVTFKAKVTPANATLQASDYAWTGIQNGSGPAINISFSASGTYTESLDVKGVVRTAIIVAFEPAIFGEAAWLAAHPSRVSSAFAIRDEALNWSVTNDAVLGGGQGNGRADAARHAYLNAIMTVDWNLADAEGLASAHERSNLNDGGNHNESAMDLENNLRGRIIGSSGDTTRPGLATRVIAALNAGLLTILDDIPNVNEVGLLKPSNQ